MGYSHQPSCHQKNDGCGSSSRFDWLLWSSLAIIVAGLMLSFSSPDMMEEGGMLSMFVHAVHELMFKMWWGVLLGIFFVGLLSRVPKEAVMQVLGKAGTLGGIIRACVAGVFLDLCSHGILLVGAKLYERGASAGQVMAFLIASPWNSISLTIIMVALIGLKWTLVFIVLSLVIAILSGLIFEALVRKGILPANPNDLGNTPTTGHLKPLLKSTFRWSSFKPSNLGRMMVEGLKEARMVLRWLFFGVVLAATIRATVPTEMFAEYFGASMLGLLFTMVAATIIEVCSEGSTPIAADLLTRANAPGNSFAFLMTGVSTDYTEIMVLRETTRSWKIALFLPLVTVPQVAAMAVILNQL